MSANPNKPKCTCSRPGYPWHDEDCETGRSLAPAAGSTARVQWEYEDRLPKNLSDAEYRAMFPMSKVDGVRLFPYVEMETGHRYYLAQ